MRREEALKTELFLLLQFTANVARRLSHDLRHPGHNPASLTVKHKELRMGDGGASSASLNMNRSHSRGGSRQITGADIKVNLNAPPCHSRNDSRIQREGVDAGTGGGSQRFASCQ